MITPVPVWFLSASGSGSSSGLCAWYSFEGAQFGIVSQWRPPEIHFARVPRELLNPEVKVLVGA